jgi:IS5 family transposase
VNWHVAMRPGTRRALKSKNSPWGSLLEKAEQLKASVRAKVEHPFRVIKCQFGFTKVRYKGLAKNTAQLIALSVSRFWCRRYFDPPAEISLTQPNICQIVFAGGFAKN